MGFDLPFAAMAKTMGKEERILPIRPRLKPVTKYPAQNTQHPISPHQLSPIPAAPRPHRWWTPAAHAITDCP